MSGSKTSAWRSARAAVDAVRRDDEVGVGELRLVRDFVLEDLVHAELAGPLLQEIQQALARDAAEAVAAADEALAGEVDVDVVPVVEAAQDRGVGFGIGRAEVRHGLVGEDHAPAEGVVGPVALVDLHPRGRQGLAQQDGGVEPCGPAPQADDSFHRVGFLCGRIRERSCAVL